MRAATSVGKGLRNYGDVSSTLGRFYIDKTLPQTKKGGLSITCSHIEETVLTIRGWLSFQRALKLRKERFSLSVWCRVS